MGDIQYQTMQRTSEYGDRITESYRYGGDRMYMYVEDAMESTKKYVVRLDDGTIVSQRVGYSCGGGSTTPQEVIAAD